MDDLDKKIKTIFKREIKLSNSYEYSIKSLLNNIDELSEKEETNNTNFEKKSNNKIIYLKMVLSTAVCFIFTIALINSNKISENLYSIYEKRNEKELIKYSAITANFSSNYTASNSDIINSKTNEKFVQDTIKVSTKDIIMDDNLLRIIFELQVSDSISKNIIYNEEINDLEVEFEDLLISDENGNVLLSVNENKACELLKIDTKLKTSEDLEKELKELENYYEGKLSFWISKYENGKIELTYDMPLSGLDKYYPRSKKLNFDISKIKINSQKHRADGGEISCYEGNWNFSLNLPEKIYDRKRITYKEISNNIGEENEVLKFDVLETRTEIKLSLKTLDVSKLNPAPCRTLIDSLEVGNPTTQIRDLIVDRFMASEEYKKYEDDLYKSYSIFDAYILDSNGNKYGYSRGAYSNGGGKVNEKNYYEPTIILDYKKENITDNLELHFTYLEKEYIFKLEKEAEI